MRFVLQEARQRTRREAGVGFFVPLAFGFYGPGQPYGINGRWYADGYSPFQYAVQLVNSQSSLGSHDAAHPLMQGVTTLDDNYRLGVTLSTGATQVAAWTDALPLAAYKGDVVAINAYLGPAATWTGQFSRVIVNAFNWLCFTPPLITSATTASATTPPQDRSGASFRPRSVLSTAN